MKGYFITATDTDAGKTFVTAGLLYAVSQLPFKTIGFKPVASGCIATAQGLRNEDALQLIAAANTQMNYSIINPYAFEPAIAPHLAAQQSGISIDIQLIKQIIRESIDKVDYAFVEGVGGWLVPLNERHSVEDLAKLLNFPVILVVNMRMGCINHALLTFQAITESGLVVAGWIANQLPEQTAMEHQEDNIASIKSRIKAPLLGVIPAGAEQQNLAQYINIAQYLL